MIKAKVNRMGYLSVRYTPLMPRDRVDLFEFSSAISKIAKSFRALQLELGKYPKPLHVQDRIQSEDGDFSFYSEPDYDLWEPSAVERLELVKHYVKVVNLFFKVRPKVE